MSYRHDEAGRLAKVVGKGLDLGEGDCGEGSGGDEPSFDIAYRADGRLESATESVTGLELRIERRPDGRIKRLVRQACDGTITSVVVDYDIEGRSRGFTNDFPGGGDLVVFDRRFDADGRVSAVASTRVDGAGTSRHVVTYGYDERGLRISERREVDGVETEFVAYEYEAIGCLPQASVDPSSASAVEFTELFFDPGPALGCGFWFDDRESLL